MLRFILAIILAPVFWGLLMFPGNLLALLVYPEAADGSVTPLGFLLLGLLFSFVYSIFAGFCSALVAGTSSMRLGLGAGIALLVFGLAVQISYWELLPLWYHLTFLASLIPFAIIGSRLRKPHETAPVGSEEEQHG